MRHIIFISFIVFVLALPFAAAELDNYFSVRDNIGEYTVLPGEEFVVWFTISNKDLVHPNNVTAYIDPCPVGWECDSKTVSYEETGIHEENITISVPKTALPKKYTLYILLESEEDTTRGNDRLVVTVLSEKQAETVKYEEYLAKEEEAAEEETPVEEAAEEEVIEEEEVAEEETPAEEEEAAEEVVEPEPQQEEPKEDIIPGLNTSEIREGVERLETSHQFVEYASIVLGALLVFVAIGAYVTFQKKN
jgi:hypothetical protein